MGRYIAAIAREQCLPLVAGTTSLSERPVQEARASIRLVGVAFLDRGTAVRDACHVPVGVLQAEERFVERAVQGVGRVPVSADQVVDVAETPDKLAFRVRRRVDSFFNDPPVRRVEVVACLVEASAGVRFLDDPAAQTVVLVLLDRVARRIVHDLHQPVPGVVGC